MSSCQVRLQRAVAGQGRVGDQRPNSPEKWKEEKVRGQGTEGAEEGAKRGWWFEMKNRKWSCGEDSNLQLPCK